MIIFFGGASDFRIELFAWPIDWQTNQPTNQRTGDVLQKRDWNRVKDGNNALYLLANDWPQSKRGLAVP